jgi:predicted AlkP superfamily phosphohydrolase/phosphomutase
MPNQTNKVFILSLDGATFDVLRPLICQGYMPNLARAMESGLVAELESVIPPVTAPAWTSFMTGKTPNKHGIFDFTRFDVDGYEWKINNSRHIRSKTIWQILSEKNKRVVVLGLPYTYPTYEINGVMVAGWDAPTVSSFTYPEQIGKEIGDLIPDYGSALDLSLWNYLPADSESDFDSFIAKLIHSFEQSTALASHFLKKENWDVFMVHFQQTDWIQHKLWGYIERACREGSDESKRLVQVRKCYRAFDQYVGRLLEEIAPFDAFQIILSDHGFGPNRGTICPNYLLRKLGYYQLDAQTESWFKRSFKHSRNTTVRNLYRTLTASRNAVRGRRAVKKYRSWADMANETLPREKVNVDWARTKAAFVGGSETGFVFVNVKGRGSLGCVEPGAEYEHIVSNLVAEFSALTNSTTGERLLARVARGSEIYSRAASGVLLPDIVLIPLAGYVVGAGLSDPFLPETGVKGDHRHNGVLIMRGPGLETSVTDFRPALIDLAPTILHALGLPVPSDIDGRVLEEIFSNSPPIRFEDIDNSTSLDPPDYAEREADLIQQRLRGLGYVE